MEEEEPKGNCENCNILLPESKLDLHEAFCIRNRRKCDLCGEFFSKDVLQVHIDEDHDADGNLKKQPSEAYSEEVVVSEKDAEEIPQLEQQFSTKECFLQQKQSSHRQVVDGKVRCSNCQKQINEAQIDIHENYCKRNCVKCPYCPEFMVKDMLEEHVKDSHIKCKYCDKRIDVNLQEVHEKMCQQGGKRCNFCEVTVPYDKFEEHEIYCGGTTDNCLYCFKFVLKKEMKLHDKICVVKNERFQLPPLVKHQSVVQENPQSFTNYLRNEIYVLAETTGISQGQAIFLLDEYGWDFQNAQMYPSYGLPELNEEEKKRLKLGQNLNACIICLSPFNQDNFYALNCKHRACTDCYSKWIKSQIKNGPKCLNTFCIFEGCPDKVGIEGFEKFLDKNDFEKYWTFVQESALLSSPKYIMCPEKNCQAIFQAKSGSEDFNIRKKQFNVFCDKCQKYFCNLCQQEAHKPLQCTTYSKFVQNKNSIRFNAFYRNFEKEQAKNKVFQNDKIKKIEEAQILIQKGKQNNAYSSRPDQFYELYRDSFSLLIEGQFLIQWAQILKIYECFPNPLTENWIDTNLTSEIIKLDELLYDGDFDQKKYQGLRDLQATLQKLLADILKDFSGFNQKNKLDGQQPSQVQQQQQQPEENFQDDISGFQPQNEIQREPSIPPELEIKCTECGTAKATVEQKYCEKCFNMLYCYNDQDEDDYDYDNNDDDDNQNEDEEDNMEEEEEEKQEEKPEQQEEQIQSQEQEQISQEQEIKPKQQEEVQQPQQQQQEQVQVQQEQTQNQAQQQQQVEQPPQQQQEQQPQQQQGSELCMMCNNNPKTIETMEGSFCDNCFGLVFN